MKNIISVYGATFYPVHIFAESTLCMVVDISTSAGANIAADSDLVFD